MITPGGCQTAYTSMGWGLSRESNIVVSQFPVGKARSDGEPDKLSSRLIE